MVGEVGDGRVVDEPEGRRTLLGTGGQHGPDLLAPAAANLAASSLRGPCDRGLNSYLAGKPCFYSRVEVARRDRPPRSGRDYQRIRLDRGHRRRHPCPVDAAVSNSRGACDASKNHPLLTRRDGARLDGSWGHGAIGLEGAKGRGRAPCRMAVGVRGNAARLGGGARLFAGSAALGCMEAGGRAVWWVAGRGGGDAGWWRVWVLGV